MPLKSKPETVVISCPEDQSLWSAAAKAGVPVVGAEFVLTGLLRQELEPQTYPFALLFFKIIILSVQ